MSATAAQPPIKAGLTALLAAFCLLLPNLHLSVLASPVVIPRELLLYLFSAIFILLLSQRDSLRYNTFFLLSLCFLIWQAFSLIWSTDQHKGIEGVLNAYVFLLAAYSLYQIRQPETQRLLLNCLIASMTIACLIGLGQNYFGDLFFIHQSRPPSSTFNNKNLAASAALLFLPIALSKLALAKELHFKLVYSLASTSMLAYILVSHTKGVWLAGIGLACIALLTYLTRRETEKRNIRDWLSGDKLYLLGILLISLALFAVPGTRSKDRLYQDLNSFAERSTNVRMGFYADALPLVKEHPLIGIGSGSLRKEYRAEPGGDYAAQHAQGNKYLSRLHNDHLQYLVEHGLIGVLFWLAVLWALYKSSISFLNKEHHAGTNRVIVFSLLMGVTGMIMHAMVSFPLRSVSTASLFWLVLGLLFAYQGNSTRSRQLHLPSVLKFTLITVMLAISVFSMTQVMNRAIGSYSAKQAAEALPKGYCFAAEFYLKNLLETTELDLYSAQLLAITYDHCPGGGPEKRIGLMDRILAFEPNHSMALIVKADAAIELGDQETAAASYRHARLVNPLEQRAYIGSARLEAENGHFKEAIELLEAALETGRENDTARELLEQYRNRL